MIRITKITMAAALFLLAALLLNLKLNAQTAPGVSSGDVPHVISYQGLITSSDGTPVNGIHHITAHLYSDRLAKNEVWKGSYDADIKGGIFSLSLGSGASPLPDIGALDHKLWIGITIDGSPEMQPLAELTSAPYALNVPDKSITLKKLADEVREGMMNGGIGHNPTAQGYGTNWSTDGNSFAATGTPILGTLSGTTQKNWEIRVNGNSIWHFQDASPPNIAADGTSVTGNASLLLTLGGTYIKTDYSGIFAGKSNTIDTLSPYSGIASGEGNDITDNHCFIGGGFGNFTHNPSHSSSVAGGDTNHICAPLSFIGGGALNVIYRNYSLIGGGQSNYIGGIEDVFTHSIIGGGSRNVMRSGHSGILGGDTNLIHLYSPYSVIGGGQRNSILFYSDHAVIAGGDTNTIYDSCDHAFIGGGQYNRIQNMSHHSSIGGGMSNFIDTVAPYNFIGGGITNTVRGNRNVIAGGDSNIIDQTLFPNSSGAFIGGGLLNYIAPGGSWDIVTGGKYNFNCGWNSVVDGGDSNTVFSRCAFDFLGGGYRNYIGDLSRLAGGTAFVEYSTLCGCTYNQIGTFWSTIGGGDSNTVTEVVAGDGTAKYATIPGGRDLQAQSYGQTVIGVLNAHKGSATETTFLDPSHKDQPLFIIGNGTFAGGPSNAFEVSNDGHATVYDLNGTGLVTLPGRAAFIGTTYTDNVINAWGDIDGTTNPPTTRADFGVKTAVQKVRVGCYVVTLNIATPASVATNLNFASITATLADLTDTSVVNDTSCAVIEVSPIGHPANNQFVVHIFGPNCVAEDRRFFFKVVGR